MVWMLTMLVSVTSCKNSETFSSNKSWPFSMQLAWRMEWLRSRLPAPFCTTSSGGLVLPINDSAGLSCTGTFKCNATFAAAEEAMGLAAGGGACGADGSEPVVTLPQIGGAHV